MTDVDRDYFVSIDSEFKAYFLGLIAAGGRFCKDIIKTSLPTSIVNKNNPHDNGLYFFLSNRNVNIKNIESHLGTLEQSVNDYDLKLAFLRGCLDFCGGHYGPISVIFRIENTGSLLLGIENEKTLNFISGFVNHPFERKGNDLIWRGSSLLDLMSELYDKSPTIYNKENILVYNELCNYISVGGCDRVVFEVEKDDEAAIIPSKEHASDSGYDLTLIKKVKELGTNTVMYDTGIIVSPAYGWYIDVVPRSSISKTGYILANSIGIIDRSYRGSIKCVLIKVDPNAPDIELPCRLLQMIPRQITNIKIVEVKECNQTKRSDGGFGSTNK